MYLDPLPGLLGQIQTLINHKNHDALMSIVKSILQQGDFFLNR